MSKYAPHRRSVNQPRATSSTICQKCLQTGHYIFDCKSSRPYVSRPSRTQQLERPKLLTKLKAEGKPSVEVPEEFKNKSGTANKILEDKEKERMKEAEAKNKEKDIMPPRKKARRSSSHSDSLTDSDSDTDSSDSDSGSDSLSSDSSKSSTSDSSRSRKRNLRRRTGRGQGHSRSVSPGSSVSRGRRS